MIVDKDTLFCSALAITASADLTDVIDMLATTVDVGEGESLQAFLQVDEAFNTLTSLKVDIVADTATNLDTAPVIVATKTILLADLALGKVHRLGTIDPIGSGKRYLGGEVTVAGSNPTTGKITVGIVKDTHGNKPALPV